MFNIKAIKTKKGYFISDDSYSVLPYYLFNGKSPQKTFSTRWFFVDEEVKSITKPVPASKINRRYELKEEYRHLNKANEKEFPLIILEKDIQLNEEDEIEEEMSTRLKVFYNFKFEEKPVGYQSFDFTFTIIAEVDEVKDYPDFSYPTNYKAGPSVNKNNILHSEIDTILYPEIFLPLRTCSLSDKDSFDIIRQHVNANINPKYARVTSDYDFGYQVCKIIDGDSTKYNQIFDKKSSKAKKFVNTERKVVLFSMTHSRAGKGHWNEYPHAPSFSGSNAEELKKNIDTFLSDLMKKINEPLKDCPHCLGHGVILE